MATENWMSPMNRVRWIRAFRSRKRSVVLRDGRRFQIRYFSKKLVPSLGVQNLALVSPVRGFVPMGLFRLERVTQREWVTESEREEQKGQYLSMLDWFLAQDEQGIDIMEQWPKMMDKKTSTLRTGFNQARSIRGVRAEGVRVIEDDNKVYLVRDNGSN